MKKLYISAVAAAVLTSGAFASDTKVSISGDAEVVYKSYDSNIKDNYSTAEVNLNINAELKDGIKFNSGFVVYDGTQADANTTAPTANMTTDHAYLEIPLNDKLSISAGLVPDEAFGTDAFEEGATVWQTIVNYKASETLTVSFADRKLQENNQDKDLNDDTEMILSAVGTFGAVEAGVSYTSTTTDTDAATEASTSIMGLYVTTEVSGIGISGEYSANGGDADGSGIFLSASKDIGKISTSLSYLTLTEGMTAGGDFAVSDYFDGNIDSSATDDTSAIVLGLGYSMNDKVGLNATLVSADVQGDGATAIDLGASYAYSDATSVGLLYTSTSGDALTDDVTGLSLTIATSF